MSRRHWLMLGILAIGLGGHVGCSSKPAGPPTVKGSVRYRGEPLGGGRIAFVPDEERGATGPLITAVIQPDGSFVLPAEVRPGWYRVAVAPPPANASVPTPGEPYPILPARYRNPRNSGLQGEVKAGAENVFHFQLDDA